MEAIITQQNSKFVLFGNTKLLKQRTLLNRWHYDKQVTFKSNSTYPWLVGHKKQLEDVHFNIL